MNSEQLSELVIDTLEELKGQDIVRIDVSALTTLTDYMIVASGTSNRHVKALSGAVVGKSKEAGHQPIGIEGQEGSEWILLDLGDTLVHVMLPRVREFYNLEKFWSLNTVRGQLATDH